MTRTVSGPARQAAILFGVVGLLRLLAVVVLPGAHVTALAVIGAANLVTAAIIWFLPWQRWPQWATLGLALPAFGFIVVSNSLGLIPQRTIAVTFVLAFVWIGSNHRRWASLFVAPLAGVAYWAAVRVDSHGVPLDVRALIIVVAVCVLVAETVARSQDRLRASSAELAFLAEHSTDLVIRNDMAGVIRYVSPSVERLLGWRTDQLVGKDVASLFHADDPGRKDMSEVAPGQPVTVIRRLRRADGSWAWFEAVAQLVTGPDGQAAVLSSGRDITERKHTEAALAYEATHDPLTGLPNRSLLAERLSAALTAERTQPLAVAFLDLDGFKDVNDSQGHEVGDRLLEQVARRLRNLLREQDTVARYGGDEFVLVIDGLPHQRDVIALAQRVETELAKPFRLADRTVHIGVSVGITFVGGGTTPEQAIAAADRAMYAKKAARRAAAAIPEPREVTVLPA